MTEYQSEPGLDPLPDSSFAADVRRYCLDLPDVWEDRPWGDIVYKVGSHMFAASSAALPLAVTVKALPEDAEALIEYPHIVSAPYLGGFGWVSITIEDEAALDQALALISMSYDLVREGGSRTRHRG